MATWNVPARRIGDGPKYNIIAGIPVHEADRRGVPFVPYKNSVIVKCQCGTEIWLGPAQQEKAQEAGVITLCVPCIARSGITIGEVRQLTDKKEGE